jgi:hypothetical protein
MCYESVLYVLWKFVICAMEVCYMCYGILLYALVMPPFGKMTIKHDMGDLFLKLLP